MPNMREKPLNLRDQRYENPEYVYGVEPNQYLKEQLEKLKPGNILFPAEGEGRNSVYAAQLGWKVSAFDLSVEGRKKISQASRKKSGFY